MATNVTHQYVTREEFDDAIRNHVIGLCVIGIILLVFIILASVAIGFLIVKLRNLYYELLRVQEQTEKQNLNAFDSLRIRDRTRYDEDQERNKPDVNVTMRKYRKPAVPSPRSSRQTLKSETSTTSTALELVIERETVKLYGCTPMLDQVMMTAQSYYKAHTDSTTDCPAEVIQIIDKHTNMRLARSTVINDDWMEGRPTSMLFTGNAESFEDVLSHNKGVFIHKKIGPNGGQLSISGILLDIPAGALSEDQLVTLGITWNEVNRPNLLANEALLSPVVLCQPSNLQFQVPVVLSFPHAAHNIHSDWIPTVLERTGDLQVDSAWSPLPRHTGCNITESRVELHLNHFTLYTCTGTGKAGVQAAKLVHVVAFAGNLAKNAFFKPRFYCINSYKDELQDVESQACKLDPSSRVAEMAPLLIHDNGNDVIVEMAKLSEPWKIAGDKQESLPFELVWHACQPHCTFVLKPGATGATDIVCEIHTYQSGNDNNCNKMKIAQHVDTHSSPLSPQGDPMSELINILVIHLDPTNEVGSDWRNLAEKMGCDLARIRWLASLNHSPTRVLLDRWFEDKKPLQELVDMMVDIERQDAAEEIRRFLPQLEKSYDRTVDC